MCKQTVQRSKGLRLSKRRGSYISYRTLLIIIIVIIIIIMCNDTFSHIFRANYNENFQCTGTGPGYKGKTNAIIITSMDTLDTEFLFS